MKLFVLLCVAIAAVSCTTSAGEKAHNFVALREKIVRHYKGEEAVQRLRRRSVAEHHQSLTEFRRNIKECDDINADASKSYSCEYNEMSVESDAERQARLGLQNMTETLEAEVMRSTLIRAQRDTGSKRSKRQAPSSIDWVARGTQPAVKNQGGCGSCWTFGAVSALEANYYILTGDKKTFAEQEYLDCAYADSKDGCNGGWMWTCYTYNANKDRMAEMSKLPYVQKDRTCDMSSIPNALTKAKVTGTTMIQGNDARLQREVLKGVVTVAIKVVSSFYSYRTGVYTCTESDCNQSINHAVTVVGYGVTSAGHKYWNVRNSWGGSWGDGGYIKMTRDDAAKNIINIHSYSQIPALECRAGQTCETPDWGDEEQEEEEEGESEKGSALQCGKIVHSGGRCLSIDDSADKFIDLSDVCERTWCITDKGYLYEEATDMCANSAAAGDNAQMKLEDTCKTKWEMVKNQGFKNQADGRCWHPQGGLASPVESTSVVTYAQCPSDDTEADARMMFSFDVEMCWEVENKMKLRGGIKKSKKSKNCDTVKESCMEDDRCQGVYYSHKKGKYMMRTNGTMIPSKKRKDLALVLVDCAGACKEGEQRCSDGDCKAECPDDEEEEEEEAECSDGAQADYRGKIAETSSGLKCQRWDSQEPHEHTRTAANYPDSGLEGNYCRNPDGEGQAWCYTTDADTRWEICTIPECESADECAAGLMKCDDGVCRHEHMC